MIHHNHLEVDNASIPEWLWPPFTVCNHRLDEETRFLYLTMQGFRTLCILPKLVKVLGDDDLRSKLDIVKQNAEWVQKEADSEFPLLHAHSVVGLWGALEVLCEDFAITWLKNVPSAPGLPEVARIKVPLSLYQQLSDDDQLRLLVSEISRSQGGDLRKGVGKLKALLGVFGLNPQIGPNLQKALHELCQVRNVVVHCAGIADQRFITECPWFGIRSGERVAVTHALCGWYYSAAKRYAERVSNQALVALGFPGCECAGADEVGPRPEPNEKLDWGTPPP